MSPNFRTTAAAAAFGATVRIRIASDRTRPRVIACIDINMSPAISRTAVEKKSFSAIRKNVKKGHI
jgi:hypothetical protein